MTILNFNFNIDLEDGDITDVEHDGEYDKLSQHEKIIVDFVTEGVIDLRSYIEDVFATLQDGDCVSGYCLPEEGIGCEKKCENYEAYIKERD